MRHLRSLLRLFRVAPDRPDLLHVRSAALIAVAVSVPASLFVLATGNGIVRAIAVAFLVLAAATAHLAFTYDRVFASLVQQSSEVRRLVDDNLRLAGHDLLTGLPDRPSFFAHLEAALGARLRNGHEVAVGLIDLDGFRPVNDT
ncbi:hypothetical protein MOX02_44220 [Methylobacterium oxalidis]|uniref:GGDEF domain-containing protein n=1 Tax=Methylobacterium oxalidis TaxID=944322 RepID=A0A512J8U5_9HYPH|nr:hypothetical protein MOX02_44220 [Methylobacterium oxalidis]GJE32958.1 hypothetical protein LDDCCGHA_3156 [Methylobacterium oxalidis]GLS63111.1 hypothetical protein GCM10007888_14920 [Methylobacterium oxalidis]